MAINPWDHQESGSHYKKFKIQPAYFCYVNNIGFLVGNVIKYILRDKENKLEDLKKAKHYLELLIYEEEKKYAEKYRGEDVEQPDLARAIQKSQQDIYKSKGKLLGAGVVFPKYLVGGGAERFSSVVDKVSTEAPEVTKEEGRGKCELDNLPDRLEVYYKTGV